MFKKRLNAVSMQKYMRCFLMLLLPGLASATTLLYKGLNELVDEADGILVGKVMSVESYRDRDNDISSLIYLDVEDVITGDYDVSSSSPFIITQKGGKLDNKTYQIAGSPEFMEGDKVVVFVRENGTSMVPFVGWNQGVFKEKHFYDSKKYGMVDAYGNKIKDVTSNSILKEVKKNATEKYARNDIFPGYQEDGISVDAPVIDDEDETVVTMNEFVNKLKTRAKGKKAASNKKLVSFDRFAVRATESAGKSTDGIGSASANKEVDQELIFDENQDKVLPKKSTSDKTNADNK